MKYKIFLKDSRFLITKSNMTLEDISKQLDRVNSEFEPYINIGDFIILKSDILMIIKED